MKGQDAWALAALVGRTRREKLATLLIAFGVCDIWHYVALKYLFNCPASQGTLDLLFLIPNAWFAPVWVPCAILAAMIAVGAWLMATYGGDGSSCPQSEDVSGDS